MTKTNCQTITARYLKPSKYRGGRFQLKTDDLLTLSKKKTKTASFPLKRDAHLVDQAREAIETAGLTILGVKSNHDEHLFMIEPNSAKLRRLFDV